MTDAKVQRELALFQEFASFLEVPVGSILNPNAGGPETGMDVLTSLKSKSIGVQLTVYHADEHQTAGTRGQTLRSQEQKKAKQAMERQGVQVYGTSAPGDFIPALTHRIRDKIAKANKYPRYTEELWLLVCAQDPRHGAAGSTFIASSVVSLDVLNRHLNPLLSSSCFDRTFLFLHDERVAYGWTKESSNWEILKKKTELDEERVRKLHEKLFGRRS